MIPEKFKDHVNDLIQDGYAVSRIDRNAIELKKWKMPPLTFIFFLMIGPIG